MRYYRTMILDDLETDEDEIQKDKKRRTHIATAVILGKVVHVSLHKLAAADAPPGTYAAYFKGDSRPLFMCTLAEIWSRGGAERDVHAWLSRVSGLAKEKLPFVVVHFDHAPDL